MSLNSKKNADDFLKIADLYKLGNLPTESPHPETTHLSDWANTDLNKAVSILQKLDNHCLTILLDNSEGMRPLHLDIQNTFNDGGRVFLCGCGATGRLALTLERIYREDFDNNDRVISFMAGGDVALISSIEKFEDYEHWGEDQLMELGFSENDLLIGSSEGGETPWVIGAVEKASLISKRKPWFLYCNPDEVLIQTIERSKRIIENNQINKLNLFCGEMAIAGSTRMQASTILTLGIGIPLLNHHRLFKNVIDELELFVKSYEKFDTSFLVEFIEEESALYLKNEYCHYQCQSHLGITILTDTTERSPTFSLPSFENQDEKITNPSLCYFSYSHKKKNEEAWHHLLGRKPRTVEWDEVKDKSSGEKLKGYDISSSCRSHRQKYLSHFESLFTIKLLELENEQKITLELNDLTSCIELPFTNNLYAHIYLKMILNTQSTLVMGRLDRFENNIMTCVKSSNNKLIDRTARNVNILLKHKGIDSSYEEIIYKIFQEKEKLHIGEPLVLKVVACYLEK